jgi:hypothetical protein
MKTLLAQFGAPKQSVDKNSINNTAGIIILGFLLF